MARPLCGLGAVLMGSGAAAWSLPSDCLLWLSAAQSGAVSKLGSWTDYSGQSHAATLVADAEVKGTPAGLVLDGTGDYATVGEVLATTTEGTAAYTALAWVKPTAVNVVGFIFDSPTDYEGNFLAIKYATDANGILTFGRFTNTANAAKSSAALSAGAWRHVGLSFSTGDAMRVYVDGVSDGTNANTGSCGFHMGLIGIRGTNRMDRNFAGEMDEIMVFSRVLTAAEILAIKNNQYKRA
jgi:hypothetical protein